MTQEENECAHPDCTVECDADTYCFGCQSHICEDHDLNLNMPMGEHLAEEHWTEDEDEGW